ncbi:MAG TPA: hypothetical protein VFH45_02720 [Acidimicrobiales bacterium]|nr:hypothetical protein [Acidimicrobiales bacterium]
MGDRPRAGFDVQAALDVLSAANAAREAALTDCRLVIRLSGRAVRAVHRHHVSEATALTGEAEQALRRAQGILAPHPALAASGFLHDAEKEFVEAVSTAAFVGGSTPPDHEHLSVGVPAWLNGVAEAASELRRQLLDCLRQGQEVEAERLLVAMEDAYDALTLVDFPDALTGGLRRTVDGLRAVLERSRADVTATMVQLRLLRTIDRAGHPGTDA